MVALLIGYARVSTDERDPTAQRDALAARGVGPARIYVDHGLTGTIRDRPGLREAMAACRAGDTLVVTELDRLARSLPDAREILDDLTKRQVKLSCREVGPWPSTLMPSSGAEPDQVGFDYLDRRPTARAGDVNRARR